MDFSETIAAQIAGLRPRVDVLAEFRFLSETIFVWNGTGRLRTNDDKVWEGIGGLGSVEGLAQSINGTAPPQNFTVSGVDERFAERVRGEREEYYLQPVLTFLQFFDEAWQPLDNPLPWTFRQMTSMTLRRGAVENGVRRYTVSIAAETPFVTRGRPPYSFLTDRDQQLRFPGDRGLERVAGIDGHPVTFPDY